MSPRRAAPAATRANANANANATANANANANANAHAHANADQTTTVRKGLKTAMGRGCWSPRNRSTTSSLQLQALGRPQRLGDDAHHRGALCFACQMALCVEGLAGLAE